MHLKVYLAASLLNINNHSSYWLVFRSVNVNASMYNFSQQF